MKPKRSHSLIFLINLMNFLILRKPPLNYSASPLNYLVSYLSTIHFRILYLFIQKLQKNFIIINNFLIRDDGDYFNTICMVHEPKTFKFIMKQIKNCKVFVDVGANIGGYSIRAAKYCKVYAIEPLPRNYKILKINEKLNNVKINSFNIAAGNKNGKVKLYYEPGAWGLPSLKHIQKEFIEVEMKPLDEIINEESIDLIKIDVEGAEDLVLEGARDCLKRTKMVIIEISESFPKAYKILKEEGFKLIKILDRIPGNIVFIKTTSN
jgi:FkbM family methyltransferase